MQDTAVSGCLYFDTMLTFCMESAVSGDTQAERKSMGLTDVIFYTYVDLHGMTSHIGVTC